MAYVLIIDDDEDFSNAAATVLRTDGYEVEIVLDTDSAITSLEARVPDLVVLDVMFPESHSAGFDLARTIRRYKNEIKDIPIIMLTAINQRFPMGFSSRDIDEHWLPVQLFIEKPVDFDYLKQKVREIIEQAVNK